MSSSAPSPSSSTSPPASQSSDAGQDDQQATGPALTSSTSLYLYTFLATLVLLLLVSATIIARSYVIRRRQRALIAEAIANGTYVPPPPRTRLGKKPKMYEVSLAKELEEHVMKEEQREGRPFSIEQEKRKQASYVGPMVEWSRIMPVSCRLRRVLRRAPESAATSSFMPQSTARSSRWRWFGRGHRQTPPPSLTPSPSTSPRTTSPIPAQPPASPTSTPADPRPSSATMRVLSPDPSETTARSPTPSSVPAPPSTDEYVRVAVLVAMPFAMAMATKKASEYGPGAEPELPYVEFGVCEVPLAQPLLEPPVDSPVSISDASLPRASGPT